MLNKVLILLIVVVGCQLNTAFAWGADGHRVIGQLGWQMLSSENQVLITKFLGSNYSLADIAPFPDNYAHTPEGNWSQPCHFCNLPRNATNFTMQYCPKFCVVKSIMNYTNILESEVSSPFECNYNETVEPCALEFLTHYVGDVHQPLHVSYTYDKGGNDVLVTFFGESTNLHHVWDTGMIEWWIYKGNWTDLAENLTVTIQENPGLVKEYLSTMDPIDWADESFQYVLHDVYIFSGNGTTTALEEETLLSRRKDRIQLKKSVEIVSDDEPDLGWWYYNQNMPIVQQRLMAAGVRLGHLLNTICDQLK